MVFVTKDQEREMLETCLTECRKRLDHYRENGMQLQADLAEADLNEILARLQREFYSKGEPCSD